MHCTGPFEQHCGERLCGILGLFNGHLGKERQAKHLVTGSLRVRQRARAITKRRVRPLQMNRSRIVDRSLHTGCRQSLADLISLTGPSNKQVVVALAIGRVLREG